MGLLHDLRSTRERGFHGRLIVAILYMERVSLFKFPFKVLRSLICQMVYHCEISPESFSSGAALLSLRLPHPYLVVVHRKVLIEQDVTIFHGVTIGAREGRHQGVPRICRNAYIGTGATILGDVSVGFGARIGAHALVMVDVKENSTVVGVLS
ncbi:TPA: hypothetical protein UME34_000583 [Stenotrophomonas maltophilia]|nr:hypothetical protein [Stenotrophomonas maltophilia]